MAIEISSGVISTGLTLSNNSMYITDGGVANSTTVNSRGSMFISSLTERQINPQPTP